MTVYHITNTSSTADASGTTTFTDILGSGVTELDITAVTSITTDGLASASVGEPGTYYVVETTASPDFVLDTTPGEVTIPDDAADGSSYNVTSTEPVGYRINLTKKGADDAYNSDGSLKYGTA